MSAKIKKVLRFNQLYKSLSFSELMKKADEEYLEFVAEMDESGSISSESKFDPHGELEERNTYVYDKQGKLLEHTLFYAIDDVTEKRILRRNDAGLLLEEVRMYGDDTGERIAYTYDSAGRVSSIVRYDEEGDFDYREEISYDGDSDKLSGRAKFDKEGKAVEKLLYAQGTDKEIVETEYHPDGSIKSTSTAHFDDNGREISVMQRMPDGKLISGVLTTYDENGNILERQFKDFYPKTMRYAYDDNNRLITQELYDGTGLLIRKNVYEYDEEGHLISEQVFEIDASRGGRDKHYGHRYEYEFYN